MNCPKCGYAQDERLDCVKCGIVFSKYVQHISDKTRQEPQAAQPRAAVSAAGEEPQSTDLSELRQSVKELTRRFSEVEFERAERNQIRSELRALDQRVKDALTQMAARVGDCEAKAAEIPDSLQDPPLDLLKEQLWEEELRPLLEKIERMEAAVDKAAQEPPQPRPDPRVAEALSKLEARVAEVEGKLLAARETANGNGSLRELADLKTAVQAATVRYSEIGDLKKNDLVLQSEIESLRGSLEAQKREPLNGGSAKLIELQTEVLALRAEVRQSFKRMADLEAAPSAHGIDLRAIVEEIEELKEGRAEDVRKLQAVAEASDDRHASAFAQVQSLAAEVRRLEEGWRSCAGTVAELQRILPEFEPLAADLKIRLAGFEAVSSELASRVTLLEQRAQAFPGSDEEQRQPIQDDVHSIRDNLDQIRAFMNTLARKL